MKFKVLWLDSGQEPQCPPDPRYPFGRDLDATAIDGAPSCKAVLPYPAPRVGSHIVTCEICGTRVGVTAAGRPDDPRSVKIACRYPGQIQ